MNSASSAHFIGNSWGGRLGFGIGDPYRAIGIERHEPYAEKAANRLCQAPLDFGELGGEAS